MATTVITVEEALDILGDQYRQMPIERVSSLILNYTLLVSKIIDTIYSSKEVPCWLQTHTKNPLP